MACDTVMKNATQYVLQLPRDESESEHQRYQSRLPVLKKYGERSETLN